MKPVVKIALASLLLTTACKPVQLYFNVPDGPEEYVHGFEDGCDTAVAAKGDFYQKLFYKLKRDANMLDNELYKRGWNEGYSFCGAYYSSLKENGPVGSGGWFIW